MTNTSTQVVRINVDPKLGDIVSTFLEHRQADVGRLQSALDRVEFETIQNLGHDIEGTGATFGFEHKILRWYLRNLIGELFGNGHGGDDNNLFDW